jgi:hypothetical protein
MTFSEALQPHRKHLGGASGRNRPRQVRASILGAVRWQVSPRTVPKTKSFRNAAEQMGGRWGHDVGGNDPGFGRPGPPKTHFARCIRYEGRSRPRCAKSSGRIAGQGEQEHVVFHTQTTESDEGPRRGQA